MHGACCYLSSLFYPFTVNTWVLLKNYCLSLLCVDFPRGASGKRTRLSVQETLRDTGSVPGLGRSLGGGHGNPLQYSCLENPMDGGAWRAVVYRVAQSRTWLSGLARMAWCCLRTCWQWCVCVQTHTLIHIPYYFTKKLKQFWNTWLQVF